MKIYAEVQTEEFWHREPDENDSWDSGSQGLKIHGVKLVRSDAYGDEVVTAATARCACSSSTTPTATRSATRRVLK